MGYPGTAPRRRPLVYLAITGVLLLLAACGGGGEEAPDAGTDGAETPVGGVATGEAPTLTEEPADTGMTEETEATEATGGTPADGATGGGMVDMSGLSFISSASPPGALGIPLFYAFDLMREWGADLEVVTITTTTGIQALIADRTNLAPHGADEMILGAAEGANPVAIGAAEASIGYVLVAGTDVESAADLEGATIGMSGPAGFDATLSRFALEDAGLDPEQDANFVQIGGSPDRAAAMLAGNVDAATIFIDDWFQLAEQTEDFHIVLPLAELTPDISGTVYFSLREFVEANPEIALGVACANLESNKWAHENPEEFVEYGTELLEGSSPEAIQNLYDFAMDVNMYPTNPEDILALNGMQQLMEAMVEAGDISEPIEDVEALLDTSYLEEAASMGCGQ